jgi:hypothetical protein
MAIGTIINMTETSKVIFKSEDDFEIIHDSCNLKSLRHAPAQATSDRSAGVTAEAADQLAEADAGVTAQSPSNQRVATPSSAPDAIDDTDKMRELVAEAPLHQRAEQIGHRRSPSRSSGLMKSNAGRLVLLNILNNFPLCSWLIDPFSRRSSS